MYIHYTVPLYSQYLQQLPKDYFIFLLPDDYDTALIIASVYAFNTKSY